MKLINKKNIDRCFKGDQNIFWDGWIANLALKRYLKKEYPEFPAVFFVHDEKLGSPDLNWAYYAQKNKQCYFLTDDYADSHGDACYINLDVSEGLFYLPVVTSRQLMDHGIALKTLAKSFKRFRQNLDHVFLTRAATFGLDLLLVKPNEDEAKRTSEDHMKEYFYHHPEQKIFYLFTKAMGRKGLVPCKDSNQLFSTLSFSHANLRKQLLKLFLHHMTTPLVQQAKNIEHKKKVKERSNQFLNYLNCSLHQNATLFDLQAQSSVYFFKKITKEIEFTLEQSSKMHINPEQYHIQHFFLNLALNRNSIFSKTYNMALDIEKKNIQRINLEQQLIPLPYYTLIKQPDQSMFRYPVYRDATDARKLFFNHQNLFEPLCDLSKTYFIGKAMPFLNELSMSPHMMAMPEQGSKYSNACGTWAKLLRNQGINIPPLHFMRIHLHALDSFKYAENIQINMPSFLSNAFGETCSSQKLSESWRKVVDECNCLLVFLSTFLPGQEIKVIRKWLNSQLPSNKVLLIEKYMGKNMSQLIKDLFIEHEALLYDRAIKKEYFAKADQQRLKVLQFEINLTFNYFKRNLVQLADGLPYLDYRPYFLAMFLFFGESFIINLLQQVTFRIDTM